MCHHLTPRKDIYVSFSQAPMDDHSISADSISMAQFLPEDQVLSSHYLRVIILVYEYGW